MTCTFLQSMCFPGEKWNKRQTSSQTVYLRLCYSFPSIPALYYWQTWQEQSWSYTDRTQTGAERCFTFCWKVARINICSHFLQGLVKKSKNRVLLSLEKWARHFIFFCASLYPWESAYNFFSLDGYLCQCNTHQKRKSCFTCVTAL